ncbi:hypothetical protein P608_03235 [Comamonas thiooxydans]|uniref:Uncharacterized protein n=1 Tax=Comamonas thiooxydans TaxID=363952 RepID=A0A0E3C677_9BURK|nr:hypothetical protein P609_23215 [Comamonas thiooxydans]KGG85084.1 hypothetical protein P369_20730 [Comamonas thiooxydans]KGG95016.1 hypothetical protein P245_07090 [Comamonas thiooxydans]KGG95224.1 hypothetical protein P367_21365 [Comamonas thiooxydans]KGH10680.1 hypothetical protein P607_25890 [Comamonas thiooxydans]
MQKSSLVIFGPWPEWLGSADWMFLESMHEVKWLFLMYP